MHGLCGHPEATWSVSKSGTLSFHYLGKWWSYICYLFSILLCTHRSSWAELDEESAVGDAKRTLKIVRREITTVVYWPKHFLAQDVPSAPILTWGYGTHSLARFLGTVDKNDYHRHAADLLIDLKNMRIDCVGQ